MRRIVIIGVAAIVLVLAVWRFIAVDSDPRARAEREHGIRLPLSAQTIQCRGDASRGLLDRGAATMFEMNTNDLPMFLNQLRVQSRTPSFRGTGDPTVNGYN